MDEGEICGDIEDIIIKNHLYRTMNKSYAVPSVFMNSHHRRRRAAEKRYILFYPILLINRYPLRKLSLNLYSSLRFLQRVDAFKLVVEVGYPNRGG